MAKLLRVLFALGIIWGSMAAHFVRPNPAVAAEIRLHVSQWQKLYDADRAERARHTQPYSEAEIQAVQDRIKELREINADSAEGQAELMKVIDDPHTLACIRLTAFSYMLEAEARQLKQIDAKSKAGEAALLQVLEDPDTPTMARLAVVEHLTSARSRSEAVHTAVLRLIGKDVDKHLCLGAINALHDLGVPADVAVPLVIPMLDDHRDCSLRGCGSGRISYAAANVLGSYGPAAKDAIPMLARGIDPVNNSAFDNWPAAHALAQIDPDQFPFFVRGEASIKLLVPQLSSDDKARRLRATQRLLEEREHAGPAVAALETALHDKDGPVRATAALVLLTMKPHLEASRVFKQLADSKDTAERALLLSWLCDYKLNFDDDEVLRGLLSDPDPAIRSKAAGRLAETDRHTAEAFETVVALYEQGGEGNQLKALIAMEDFQPESLAAVKDLIAEAAGRQGSIGYVAKRLQRRKLAGEAEGGAGK
jgi:hypothetical protein